MGRTLQASPHALKARIRLRATRKHVHFSISMRVSRLCLFCSVFSSTQYFWGLASVPTVQLSNGVRMPLIADGTFLYNDSVAQDSITKGLKVGFTMFDTALGYNNQVGVGRAFQGVARESFFLMTKVPGCGT